MKKILFVLSVLLMQTATFSVFAQSKPKAGDKISGVVSDSEGPMIMVNVTERDSLNRIVAHVVTDIEGNFSFRLVDPDHIIRVTYVGYESVSIPIDTTYFEIKMKERDDLPKVWIILDPGFEKEGNVPFYIPPRDPSDEDLIKIDMSEFESKGMHTIDEVLVGKIPARDLIMAEEMAFADFVEPKYFFIAMPSVYGISAILKSALTLRTPDAGVFPSVPSVRNSRYCLSLQTLQRFALIWHFH